MHDIGIDLGTTNILIYTTKKGIVLNEPSIAAKDKKTGKIIAIGNEAQEMLGKTPENVEIIRPMKDGVIADFDTTEIILKSFIKKVFSRRLLTKPNILICSPSSITGVEKNALIEMVERLGAKKAYIEEEPKVAAIGAGIDIFKPTGSLIVDIGGGTTDIAILSLGQIVISNSIKIAGNAFNEDIITFVKNKYKIILGEQTTEELKKEIGTVLKTKNKTMEVTGRSIDNGLPETIVVTNKDIEEALKNDLKKIVEAIKQVLEKSPPELLKDIKEKGLILTGGSSLIDGIVEKLRKELKIPVFVSDCPLTNVIEGTGYLLTNSNLIEY